MSEKNQNKITAVKIQMYTMGTGDCFVLLFMHEETTVFKMMIDCGVWSGSHEKIQEYVAELKKNVDEKLDVLVITHEHKDHVYGFEAAEELFTKDLTIEQIWMAWTENDQDEKVAGWKEEHGKKRKALALAAQALKERVASDSFKQQFAGSKLNQALFNMRSQFAGAVNDFAELHVSGGDYVGNLKGMAVVKDTLAKNNISYFKPGDVIENLIGLEGVRIYVLGPPEQWQDIQKETGDGDEAYRHNKELEESDLFLQAFLTREDDPFSQTYAPFDENYETEPATFADMYLKDGDAWRRIDDDWLFSSGAFALRLTSYINNLSLVLAIEFIESGKVLVFPGDAEIGSWNSWQKINWSTKGLPIKTEDILKRTVFYKVAHHLSHNGTAKSNGLDLMTHPDLVAMATLDYDVISNGWKSTMPNRLIVKDLLEKTKGRVLIMNEQGLFFDLENLSPLAEKIEEYRKKLSAGERDAFDNSVTRSKLVTEYIFQV
jgi:hypothetical protein